MKSAKFQKTAKASHFERTTSASRNRHGQYSTCDERAPKEKHSLKSKNNLLARQNAPKYSSQPPLHRIPQFHPIIPCPTTLLPNTKLTLRPIIPSPPIPKSNCFPKAKGTASLATAGTSRQCNTDAASVCEDRRSPSRLHPPSASRSKSWPGGSMKDILYDKETPFSRLL